MNREDAERASKKLDEWANDPDTNFDDRVSSAMGDHGLVRGGQGRSGRDVRWAGLLVSIASAMAVLTVIYCVRCAVTREKRPVVDIRQNPPSPAWRATEHTRGHWNGSAIEFTACYSLGGMAYRIRAINDHIRAVEFVEREVKNG